jgi:eukaryotic-like serine/threonine-protein kinase
MLFIGSCAGVFYALDKNTGKVLWSHDAARGEKKVGFHGDPIITDDLVVVGTDINGEASGNGYVYAFERAAGKERWKVAAGRGIASDLVRIESSLFGVTLSDEIVSVDLASGKRNWTFTSREGRDDRIPSAPSSSSGYLFYGDRDGGLFAINSKDGRVVWRRELTTPVSTSLVASGDSVYFGAANHLYRVNQKTGEIEAHLLAGGWSFGRPIITGDSLLLFIGDTLASFDLSLKKEVSEQVDDTTAPAARPDCSGRE